MKVTLTGMLRMMKTCFLRGKEGLVKAFLHIVALTSLGSDLTGMRIHQNRVKQKRAHSSCCT